MNPQMVVSYITKACLLVLPMLVTFGLLSQDTVTQIMELVQKLPEVLVWIMNLVAFVGTIVSIFRTFKNYKKPAA